ncbi:MAG: RING finger protein [Planctomycetota bacterium]
MSADRCPYCLADLAVADEPPDEPVVACKRCATPHHLACWEEHGRCTIFACGELHHVSEVVRQLTAGSLSPFRPLDDEPGSVAPTFLRVNSSFRESSRSLWKRKPRLELSVPGTLRCGSPLEGKLTVHAPREVIGQGLRLTVAALVQSPQGQDEVVSLREAVLRGGASRGWLQRALGWAKDEERQELAPPGVSTFRFSCDFTQNPLPELPKHPTFGTWHVLRVHATLDQGGKLNESRQARVLVSHGLGRCKHAERKRRVGPIKIRYRGADPNLPFGHSRD